MSKETLSEDDVKKVLASSGIPRQYWSSSKSLRELSFKDIHGAKIFEKERTVMLENLNDNFKFLTKRANQRVLLASNVDLFYLYGRGLLLRGLSMRFVNLLELSMGFDHFIANVGKYRVLALDGFYSVNKSDMLDSRIDWFVRCCIMQGVSLIFLTNGQKTPWLEPETIQMIDRLTVTFEEAKK